ncbi:MAG: hypothetical protein ACRER7_02505 [Gammaproteobacteria bacterium]
MTQQNFRHRGFTIKVITHEIFPGSHDAKKHFGWHVASVVISRGTQDEHNYHEKFLHPDRISVTPECAINYGRKFAARVIDEKILYENLSNFLSVRPI